LEFWEQLEFESVLLKMRDEMDKDIFKKKLQEVKEHLKFKPIEDERTLTELLTLGDEWDRPEVLVRAMDEHPEWEARYAAMLRDVENEKDAAQAKMDFFMSVTLERFEDLIFEANKAKGMTANNAKPTAAKVKGAFTVKIVNGDPDDADPFFWDMDEDGEVEAVYETCGERVKKYQELFKELDEAIARYDQIKIITQAFKNRKDMLISISSLVGKLVDNGLIVLRKASRKKVADDDGFVKQDY
jgi:hypothetical protein